MEPYKQLVLIRSKTTFPRGLLNVTLHKEPVAKNNNLQGFVYKTF